jgi:hypothetical protein
VGLFRLARAEYSAPAWRCQEVDAGAARLWGSRVPRCVDQGVKGRGDYGARHVGLVASRQALWADSLALLHVHLHHFAGDVEDHSLADVEHAIGGPLQVVDHPE